MFVWKKYFFETSDTFLENSNKHFFQEKKTKEIGYLKNKEIGNKNLRIF